MLDFRLHLCFYGLVLPCLLIKPIWCSLFLLLQAECAYQVIPRQRLPAKPAQLLRVVEIASEFDGIAVQIFASPVSHLVFCVPGQLVPDIPDGDHFPL